MFDQAGGNKTKLDIHKLHYFYVLSQTDYENLTFGSNYLSET